MDCTQRAFDGISLSDSNCYLEYLSGAKYVLMWSKET
jgi:hypothetical protein